MTTSEEALVSERIATARRITVLTGAGVSAASGVPTFRGSDGLWKSFRPEALATPQAFRRNPLLVWEWYDWRRQVIARCELNAAHQVLAAWSRRYPGFTLVTQNVDGLHERAGTRNTVRIHGSIWNLSCWSRCGGVPSEWRDDTVPFATLPPRCPACGGYVRPAVVWFGEAIDPDVMGRCLQAAETDVFLTVGTSAVVHPAAGLMGVARQHGAFTAAINLEATEASELADVSLHGPAEEILPRLEHRLR